MDFPPCYATGGFFSVYHKKLYLYEKHRKKAQKVLSWSDYHYIKPKGTDCARVIFFFRHCQIAIQEHQKEVGKVLALPPLLSCCRTVLQFLLIRFSASPAEIPPKCDALMRKSIPLYRFFCFFLGNKIRHNPFEQKSAEIRNGINPVVMSQIILGQLDSIPNIGVFFGLNQG